MVSKYTSCPIIALFLIVIFSSACLATLGDCNGDGYYSIADFVKLARYLNGDEPVSPEIFNCDCDGFPGVNYADYLQLVVGPPFYGYGTDYPQQSDVRFYLNVQIPPDQDDFELEIYVDVPDDFSMEAFLLPLSFEAGGSQAPAEFLSADFTGTVADPDAIGVSQSSAGDILKIEANSIEQIGFPVLSGGASGLLCKLHFATGSGEPNDLRITRLGPSWPMLIKRLIYPCTDGGRIYLPQFIRAPYGDGNSDGVVNLSDAVRIVNYIFLNGPAPGSDEP